MTAKQYLQQLRKIALQMSVLRDEILRMRSRLESTTVPLKPDRVQSSSKGDSFADAIAVMADKSVQYESLMLIYEDMRQRIIGQILELDEPRYIEILQKRYVKNEQLKAIAVDMHYSETYAARLLNQALAAFEAKHPILFKQDSQR